MAARRACPFCRSPPETAGLSNARPPPGRKPLLTARNRTRATVARTVARDTAHMTFLGLRDAARQVGMHRSNLYRAIQSGRLSATRTDEGGYAIDPAELFRVYPPKAVASDPEADRSAGQNAIAIAPINSTKMLVRQAQLEAAVSGLQAILEAERKRGEEL